MNETVKQAARLLHQALQDDPLIQEYNRLAALIQTHPHIQQQETQLKEMQQAMVHLLDEHQEEAYQKKVVEYQRARAAFDEDPLLHNYLELKEEVNDLMQELATLLNTFDSACDE